MADAFTTNFVSSTYSAAVYQLITMLTGAGWVGKASGDGSAAFSSTTNLFTGSGSGANKTGNATGWIRLQDPGGTAEFVFQWDNVGGLRVLYSPSAKFTGGSPSATQVPTATDQQFVCGAGTPASPTYKTAMFPTNANAGTEKFQGGARGTAPYGWWMAGGVTGGSVCNFGLAYDPVSGDASDTNQYVCYTDKGAAFSSAQLTAVTAPAQNADCVEAFIDVAKTVWTGFGASIYSVASTSIAGTGGVGVNPFSGNLDQKPILYERNAAQSGTTGQKGYSTNFRWTSVAKSNFVDTAASKAWICLGSVWAFWDGATVPSQ